jgi:hypothetical protein
VSKRCTLALSDEPRFQRLCARLPRHRQEQCARRGRMVEVIGTQAAPAQITPTIAMTISAERGFAMQTSSPRPPRRNWSSLARASARRISSHYHPALAIDDRDCLIANSRHFPHPTMKTGSVDPPRLRPSDQEYRQKSNVHKRALRSMSSSG